MRVVFFQIAILSALFLTLPAESQEPENKEAIIAQSEAGLVRVVTETFAREDCLAPVAITRIDGFESAVSAKEFLIEPGFHTLNGRATLDTTKCHQVEGELELNKAVDLEVNFELGNTYYIAYDRSSLNSKEWKLVVWKVEQAQPLEEPSAAPGQ